jgi:hypothetical protein
VFRCLRAYPLVGPSANPYRDNPKKTYVYYVQLGRQARRIQTFLDDRTAVMRLLEAKLDHLVEYEPNRFIPRFDARDEFPLASRLGLWFDGKAYRFLLFDRPEDRARWLLGKHWVDTPSDLANYEWPTEEEWQKQLEEDRKEAHGILKDDEWTDAPEWPEAEHKEENKEKE